MNLADYKMLVESTNKATVRAGYHSPCNISLHLRLDDHLDRPIPLLDEHFHEHCQNLAASFDQVEFCHSYESSAAF
jgi:hypothetical protein